MEETLLMILEQKRSFMTQQGEELHMKKSPAPHCPFNGLCGRVTGLLALRPESFPGPNVSARCSVFSLPPCSSSLVLSSPFTCKVKSEFLSMSIAGQFYFIL